jgi:hypothetical protein
VFSFLRENLDLNDNNVHKHKTCKINNNKTARTSNTATITHILNMTITIIREEEEEETKNCPTHQQQQLLNCVALCKELRFNSPP